MTVLVQLCVVNCSLEYTLKISESSVAFLDINISMDANGLSTSVHYKPADPHSYLIHSFSCPRTHVTNSMMILNSLQCDVSAGFSLDSSPPSQKKCDNFSKTVAFLILL